MHAIVKGGMEKSSAVLDICEPYEMWDQSTRLYVPT